MIHNIYSEDSWNSCWFLKVNCLGVQLYAKQVNFVLGYSCDRQLHSIIWMYSFMPSMSALVKVTRVTGSYLKLFREICCVEGVPFHQSGWIFLLYCHTATWWLVLREINSLLPSDTIWWHRFRSPLALLMACCLKPLSHCLNQCWLIISEILWHSHKGNFTGNEDINSWYGNYYLFEITTASDRGQWVKTPFSRHMCCGFS